MGSHEWNSTRNSLRSVEGVDEALKRGLAVVSMKDNGKTIFPTKK
jgi:hypothetical protein